MRLPRPAPARRLRLLAAAGCAALGGTALGAVAAATAPGAGHASVDLVVRAAPGAAPAVAAAVRALGGRVIAPLP